VFVTPDIAKARLHDKTVDELVRRLEKKPHLEITPYHNYKRERGNIRIVGEVDVLVRVGDRWRFYEVKINRTNSNYKKAVEQYHRFCRAYPDRDIVGIYVTRTSIKRLKPYKPVREPLQEEMTLMEERFRAANF
jgi:hypothetical protein